MSTELPTSNSLLEENTSLSVTDSTSIFPYEDMPLSQNETFPEPVNNCAYCDVIIMTVIYGIITVTGMLGNVVTCIVIGKNRQMHTATNYYLFSMAISDILLLVTAMPHEMVILWGVSPYPLGEPFCVFRGLAAETSTNATILTIAAFTVERYIAICHPYRAQTMSKLGRIIKFIKGIWVIACGCAVPQAIQYGIVNGNCEVKNKNVVAFQVSTFLFFILPMTLITVVYVKIGVVLRRSSQLAKNASSFASQRTGSSMHVERPRNKGAIKMLIAVVIAFFLCFAPFHAQRLLALYGDENNQLTVDIYVFLQHFSGIFFFLSTCINPILYHIMSRKFRKALKTTVDVCCRRPDSVSSGGGRSWTNGRRSRHDTINNVELTELTGLNTDFDTPTHSFRAKITNFSKNKRFSSKSLSSRPSDVQAVNVLKPKKSLAGFRFFKSNARLTLRKCKRDTNKFEVTYKAKPGLMANPISEDEELPSTSGDIPCNQLNGGNRKMSKASSVNTGSSISFGFSDANDVEELKFPRASTHHHSGSSSRKYKFREQRSFQSLEICREDQRQSKKRLCDDFELEEDRLNSPREDESNQVRNGSAHTWV